jgi:hypothetical protein
MQNSFFVAEGPGLLCHRLSRPVPLFQRDFAFICFVPQQDTGSIGAMGRGGFVVVVIRNKQKMLAQLVKYLIEL